VNDPRHNYQGPRPLCIQCELRESAAGTDGLCEYCRGKAYKAGTHPKEATIKKDIIKFLNRLPRSEFEVSRPGSPTGKPDITGCLRGIYMAIEVKTLSGYARKIQKYRMKRLREAGAIVFVATTVEKVEERIRGMGW